MSPTNPSVGRPRDPDIDEAVLQAARRHLASRGYDAMSIIAVAEEAGTSRQALYRRWPSKADLATAAISSLSEADQRPDTDDPYRDLIDELTAFHRGVTRPNGISMVGSMLQSSTDQELRRLFQQRIVEPRRRRIKHILGRAADMNLIDPNLETNYAAAAATGTLYALHLAGQPTPRTWPAKTAALVWRSLGGEPPLGSSDG